MAVDLEQAPKAEMTAGVSVSLPVSMLVWVNDQLEKGKESRAALFLEALELLGEKREQVAA